MIRTSKHKISYANFDKLKRYKSFLKEMRRVASIYVDYLWNTNYEWKDKNKIIKVMDITKDKLEVPPYFDYNLISVETSLSARALSSLVTQCCGIVKACTEKQRKRLYLLEDKKKKKENIPEKLLENIKKFKPVKPNVERINIEVSSKCCDFQENKANSFFEGFLRLKSLGKDFGFIKIPVKFHKQSKKWKNKSEMLKSFLLCSDKLEIRWKCEVPLKTKGIDVGADQGKRDVMFLSDKQVSPKNNAHGKSFELIMEKMARKKYGSKNFRQAQEERKNFINFSINRLNFSNIKKVKLEKIENINYKKNTSRLMKRWTNTLIRDKMMRKCEELGVQVIEQSSAYRSQRCSHCGIVLKKNRKGKEYFCRSCGIMIDADYNASLNHEVELPEVPFWLSNLHLNRSKGFFWNPSGFFGVDGEELRVPHSNQKISLT